MTTDDKSTKNPSKPGATAAKATSFDKNKKAKLPQDQLKAEACQTVAHIMCSDPIKFGARFRVVRMDDGSRLIVKFDENNVLRTYPKESLLQDIQNFCYMHWNSVSGRKTLMGSDAKEIMSLFTTMAATVSEKDIEPVGLFGGYGYCWSRLEWELTDGPTPVFDDLFERMSDGQAVKAWIGSIFELRSERAMYLWLHSDGGDGKSSLTEVLEKILGVGATEEVTSRVSGQFWTSGIVGKRLVCFGDTDDEKFVTTGLFKGLSGGSSQRVEFKGGATVNMMLNPKFIFLSNKKPELGRSSADKRRALIIEVDKAVKYQLPPEEYKQRLWEEAPHFIKECKDIYRELCPNFGSIPISEKVKEQIDEIIGDGEERFEVVFERHFVDQREWVLGFTRAKKSRKGYVNVCLERDCFVSANILHLVFEEEKLNKTDRRLFREFLEKKYKVIKKRSVYRNIQDTRYLGLTVHKTSKVGDFVHKPGK